MLTTLTTAPEHLALIFTGLDRFDAIALSRTCKSLAAISGDHREDFRPTELHSIRFTGTFGAPF